jgi:YVTN family beta-propeller protein
MANTSGVTEVSGTAGVAVAERVAAAHSMWLSTLPTIRRAPVAELVPLAEPVTAPMVTVAGAVAAGHGPISDMAVSRDGRCLVAAHYGADVVSIVDTATLSVTATVTGVAEPYAVAVADRAYVTTASTEDESVVAIDTTTGVAFAAKDIDASARALAVSPAGDVLYVARTGDDLPDIAAIDIESGATRVIAIPAAPGASVEALRVSADGTRLFAALTTVTGGTLLIIDTRSRAVERAVAIAGSIGDIAVTLAGRKVFATGWDAELGGVVNVIDVAAARVTDTIGVGGMPTQLVVGHRGELVYVVDRNEIVVLCAITNEVVDTIPAGGQLSCLAAGPDGRLYVADYAGAISVLQVGASTDSALLELMAAELPQLAVAAF